MIFALACAEAHEPLYFDAATSTSEDPSEPCEPEIEVTWENWGGAFLLTHCQGCHAGSTAERYGAPESVVFDTEAAALAQAATIHEVVLADETMPPSGGLTDSERYLLDQWLCGYL